MSRPKFPRYSDAKREAIEAFEVEYFRRLHEAGQGNVSAMSRLSGIERARIRFYMTRHGLKTRRTVQTVEELLELVDEALARQFRAEKEAT